MSEDGCCMLWRRLLPSDKLWLVKGGKDWRKGVYEALDNEVDRGGGILAPSLLVGVEANSELNAKT